MAGSHLQRGRLVQIPGTPGGERLGGLSRHAPGQQSGAKEVVAVQPLQIHRQQIQCWRFPDGRHYPARLREVEYHHHALRGCICHGEVRFLSGTDQGGEKYRLHHGLPAG